MVIEGLLIAVTKPTKLVGLVLLCLLFDLAGLHAQWRRLIHGYDDGGSSFGCITFLDSSTRVGFATVDDSIYKTTDGGYTWKASFASILEAANAFAFKDSMVGWGSWVIKTTDGGSTWFKTGNYSPLTGPIPDGPNDIYYDAKYHALLLAGNTQGVWISYDDGVNWTESINLNAIGEFDNAAQAFSFWNDDTGVVAIFDGFYLTTDGGSTWQPVADIADALSQVLAIPGTTTGFAIDKFGVVRRTDDLWRTWQDVYHFAPEIAPDFSSGMPGPPSSMCITGDLQNLYVTLDSGCFRSTDQGKSWKYLCGVGPTDLYYYTRFYAKGNRVFIPSLSYQNGTDIWMLNVDSMQYFPSGIAFSDSSNQKTVQPGTPVTINYFPETSDPIGIDTGVLVFRYDSDALDIKNIQLQQGWKLVSESSHNGILTLKIIADSGIAIANPMVSLAFNTYLSQSSGNSTHVYLDSTYLSGHRLNCDCQALSTGAPDSVTINFTGCGDSLLEAEMNQEQPFTIESVVPNPANASVRVEGSGQKVDAQLFDDLGHRVIPSAEYSLPFSLNVGQLPSGIYFLRLSSGGYSVSRSVTVEK